MPSNNKIGEYHAAKMSEIVSSGVQPYMFKPEMDTDKESQEEVTTFRMQLDVSVRLI